MKTTKGLKTAVLLFMAMFLFVACQTPAGRTSGQVVDDTTIGTKVKAKLFEDPNLSGFAINVNTFEGDVTLTGAVDSQTEKTRATKIAQSVEGVRKVNNLLKVGR